MQYAFAKASSDLLKDNHNISMPDDQDYLVISAIPLLEGKKDAPSNSMWLFIEPLTAVNNADIVMARLMTWLCDIKGLDQRELYGDQWDNYNITLFHFPKRGHGYASIVDEFSLTEYCLPDCNGSLAADFEGLMRILDRDRMLRDMHKALVRDFNIKNTGQPRRVVRLQFRELCHPDYPSLSRPALAA